ncbi:hypothetical protein [Oerskovia merdavium]|uniref:Uncharacterized protein n=1 Tax=Oerskovia merdavium TaxID=2762227 RepID=A0ABR8U345_9CELL|nr:hypothetical protein [Oerskovia merdavium]MBD7981959.1 hypothetical protein [Oerskovia merdavium]
MTTAETNSNGYRNYTSDGTYWTGRKAGNGNIEVVRVKTGNYGVVESFGTYSRLGSAVAAAAQLAYVQGWTDAQHDLSSKVHLALADAGIAPVVIPGPDVDLYDEESDED